VKLLSYSRLYKNLQPIEPTQFEHYKAAVFSIICNLFTVTVIFPVCSFQSILVRYRQWNDLILSSDDERKTSLSVVYILCTSLRCDSLRGLNNSRLSSRTNKFSQSHLGRARRYPSRQRMHSSAACASCATSTADTSRYSAAGTLYPRVPTIQWTLSHHLKPTVS